ncbi:acid-sensing ion channel 1C-like [Patella vulgata]|uniref:acid-sensing ion channel 1C-like n=1 Tax=Patella vulgata TaxID=6465 RepID=UPI0024A977B0|nr:acid-sensing ion channel 1C-like [Patella vulgata]
MVGTLMYTTCTFFMKYLEFNFVTRTSVTYHHELEFPAITLCSLNPFDKNKFKKSNIYNTNKADPRVADYVEHIRRGRRVINESYSKWIDLRPDETELNKLGFDINDMILNSLIKPGKSYNVKSEFSVTYPLPLQKCFTFNGRYWNKTYDHKPLKFKADTYLYLKLDTHTDRYAFNTWTIGVQLILHHPDDPFHNRSLSFVLSPGYLHRIQISEKRYKYLTSPYNSYQNQECVQVEKSNQGSGEYRPPYSYGDCIIKCLTNRTQSLCGCIIESLLHDSSSVFCTVAERHSCALRLSRSPEFCDCKRPCFETKYDYELSSYTLTPDRWSPSTLFSTIEFKDMTITSVEHEPELDIGDIISHLGGYMGFCLGASVLTFIEMVEVVLKSLKAIRLHRQSTVNSPQISPPNPGENHEIDSN